VKKLKRNNEILVIIPAYNEEDNIKNVIHSISATYPSYDILVIDDGSRDNTANFARQTKLANVISLPYNIGIGGSVQTGFKFARKYGYKFAIQFDGDGQHLVEEIKKILRPVISGDADCMIGSRFVQNDENYHPDLLRKFGIYILRQYSYLYIGQRISDQTSGFRAFNKECIDALADYYPKDYPEPEVIVFLGRNNFVIKEVFTQMKERQGGVSSIPTWNGPLYMAKVILSMTMARVRSKRKLKNKK